MKPLPHTYEIAVTGSAEGYAAASAAGLPPLQTAPPLDFGGPGDAWSPEHLLLTAAAACFVFTFRAVMRAAGVRFEHVSVAARGTVARHAGTTRFTEIVLVPTIAVDASVDRDRLVGLIDKAEDHCLVSASLSTPVRVEAEFVDASAASAA